MEEIKTALMPFELFIRKGLALLKEDMQKNSSFDPKRNYHEKNRYIERANNYGGPLLTEGIHWAADLYYWSLLKHIKDYEQESGKHFNKGVVYANLGIAQIAQGKFDAGIAHLLTAEWEDREVANPQEFILDSILWKQFEAKVFQYLIGYSGQHGVTFTIDNGFLGNFFTGIDREDRIFLQGTVLALLDNLDQLNNVHSNSFTYGRLYSFLKDICLLIESLLRKKLNSTSVNPSVKKDLYNLLVNALKSQNIIWPQPNLAHSPKPIDFQQFVDQLDAILTGTVLQEEIRLANCVYLVRNFTGHHFKFDENIKSSSGKSFFSDFYIQALEKIVATLLYLSHIKAI